MNNAYTYSLRLLAMRDYSRFKLTQKLKLKEFTLDEINQAIERLEEKGYLQENRYKTLVIRKWINKGLADRAIMLSAKREHLIVTSDEIQSIRNDMGQSTMIAGEQLVLKKLKFKSPPKSFEEMQKLKAQLFRHLQSKGYSYEESQKLLKSHFQSESFLD